MADASWSSAELAKALCDVLISKGQLKEKPAFIRTDREAKIVSVFEGIGLDGAKMMTFDNPGPLEMLLRRATNGETWVQQSLDALITMLPEAAATATKKMAMDEDTKEELAAAKEKSEQRRQRLEEERGGEEEGGRRGGDRGGDRGDRGGDRGDRGGDRGGGGRFQDDDRDERGGRSGGYQDRGGDRDERPRGGGGMENMECFNCGQKGHSSRDCPEPRKEKGKGRGKGDHREMQCNNCKGFGHKSRDCPEPVDEEAVAERLAAKAAKDSAARRRSDDE
ncbi:unnamed protein product [Polarella glacialis]|uniref:CCHC-type domain-containing protein n=1 Tax=Polarella glacialis TaxID=89957 RepID=A0A813GT04_POLGL|nr:unnamed protein product [Polarella glacialis]